MTTTTQPPSEHPRWEAFRRNFSESNYITDFWNWFMTLMSKAAEMVLFATVLYSGYQLLPGVPHVPPAIDAAVFVIQQGALDIGGMGLLKLARRAGLAKESFPVRLGVALVVLMILNVALASIKHTLPMIPDGVYVGIETLLLIARAVVAVLFGHAIHALREEFSDSPLTVKEAVELQQRIELLAGELAGLQENFRHQLTSELSQMREIIQQAEAHVEALTRQQHTLAEALHEAREAAPARQHEAEPSASPRTTESGTKVLPLRQMRQREIAPSEKRRAVYTLLETDSRLSSYEIAERTGYPPSTIQRYMKDWKAKQVEAAHEANSSAS